MGGPGDNEQQQTNTASAGVGAAWVFTRSNGVWTQQQKLVGSGVTGSFANQGASVALSADGSTAVVGGPYDNGSEYQGFIDSEGAVWVFTLSNGTWTQQQKLVLGNGDVALGTSVGLSADGNTIIAGALARSPRQASARRGSLPRAMALTEQTATCRHRYRLYL